ncbi:hypothetical protein HC026_00315 [Lactobacillus sp. LC28-10]|uniref:Uncharacterized protein n=1 Tax=Secundilactobacillus angelensis TaxID=2722706 RepID=A0ABX1KTV4_9LACO|nr:hypothetical protein [Secundilactobacillus angelensis]MCH5461867.1 hypothetical protein [Secundilactobacillus angelensis]NLR17354.1 hypothetical protein [Secundilactobacillus angelensis]
MTAVQVLETFIQGKVNDEKCEDTIVVTPEFIGVIDGVTSKSQFMYQGQTTGKLASTMIAGVLERLPKEATLSSLIERVNQQFADFYNRVKFTADRASQGLQAVAVIYSRFRNELWQVGDAQINLDGRLLTNPKASDLVLSNMRSLILRLSPNSNDELDPGRQAILPWILQATQFANSTDREWGYAIFNGQPIPESLLKIYHLSAESHQIVLASDGYPKLAENLADSEAALANVLENDPSCSHEYRSTKGLKKGNRSFDDRSLVHFKVSSANDE